MPRRTLSDEAYIIDLCDEVLGTPALQGIVGGIVVARLRAFTQQTPPARAPAEAEKMLGRLLRNPR